MPQSSDGRVVAITGANGGIGSHMLAALVEDGYRVAGLDVEGRAIKPLADAHPESVRYEACDVTDTESVESAVAAVLDAWNRIDILVNNAGVAGFSRFEETSMDDVRREFEVNFFGGQRTTRAVLPVMRRQGEGIIHNVSSGAALGGHPGMAGYAASKGAVEAFARSLRIELRDSDIAVTLMQPPMTATRMTEGLGYPSWLLNDPGAVGRKLAAKIESTDPVVHADRQTWLGLTLIQLAPWLWRAATDRLVDRPE
ncbi:SDR family NAD(P)-dependent oxidoreductase [Natronomonas marina]|uniref:SDR family NAD(P)-dependent oxidoreductase n=1 Tax=Natronomonas marina TaxID=2961939 RepID=UPI0020C98256|nr:SDR family NAD(P)-dependent oxidoreductase [Natronomonas marina]